MKSCTRVIVLLKVKGSKVMFALVVIALQGLPDDTRLYALERLMCTLGSSQPWRTEQQAGRHKKKLAQH